MSTQAAVIEAVPTRRTQRWDVLGGSGILSVAVLASGLLAYAFQVLCARTLGADAFGQLAVLWAAVFLATVILFRPIEQTLSRALADRMARARRSAPSLGPLAGSQPSSRSSSSGLSRWRGDP